MPAHPPSPAAAHEADDPLHRERAHLRASRAALRAMRDEVAALDPERAAANPVNAEALRHTVQARLAALADLPDTPLFFGRLDRRDGTSYHIGRRHVRDADGNPMVVDWRAPVSQPFYRASREDPQGVVLRRRFGFTGGELTAYEDEHLTAGGPASPRAGALLRAEIERPRVGPMRDIVATIQPEQDEIVRADIGTTVCVQGAPGTGKTAVGLHRVAYLLYTHRERLARSGTLVIGPNRSFLRYIEQVLPALGELDVRQTTVDDLVAEAHGLTVRAVDDPATARVKGDARMAEVLRRAVYGGVSLPTEPLLVTRGSRRWRVPAWEVEEIVTELLERGIRYEAARQALPQRLAHAVLVRMERSGEAPDDRVQDAVARNAAVKAAVKRILPPVDPVRLVFRLLSDADFLAEHACDLLSEEERKALLWPRPPRGPRSARWSAADAVLIDEAADLVERTRSLGHVVLDEAQDLTPMQYRAVGRRCATGSATVLGDLAQGTTPWATDSWATALAHLGTPQARVTELTRGFRVPSEVIAFASRLLPAIAPELTEATSVRESEGALRVRAVAPQELTEAVVAACREALAQEGSVGLIAAEARLPELAEALRGAGLDWLSPGDEAADGTRLTLVPVTLAKGLEYDQVVLDEPAAVVDGEPDERTGLRRLYVALTRAVSGLTVVHAAPLPSRLAG